MVTEKEKKICQCRSCNHTFHQRDGAKVNKKFYGQDIITTVCPECGSGYGLVTYINRMTVEGVYKTDRFFNMG